MALSIAQDSQAVATNLVSIGIDPSNLDSLSANLGRTPCSAHVPLQQKTSPSTTTTTTTAHSRWDSLEQSTSLSQQNTHNPPTSIIVPAIDLESLQTVSECDEALKRLIVCHSL